MAAHVLPPDHGPLRADLRDLYLWPSSPRAGLGKQRTSRRRNCGNLRGFRCLSPDCRSGGCGFESRRARLKTPFPLAGRAFFVSLSALHFAPFAGWVAGDAARLADVMWSLRPPTVWTRFRWPSSSRGRRGFARRSKEIPNRPMEEGLQKCESRDVRRWQYVRIGAAPRDRTPSQCWDRGHLPATSGRCPSCWTS